jgi:hypothetical protein
MDGTYVSGTAATLNKQASDHSHMPYAATVHRPEICRLYDRHNHHYLQALEMLHKACIDWCGHRVARLSSCGRHTAGTRVLRDMLPERYRIQLQDDSVTD